MATPKPINPLNSGQLDLRTVVDAVVRRSRWPASKAKSAELWYRRFLRLSQQQSQKTGKVAALFGLAFDADELWHEHITQTIKYQQDCQRIFGAYLNHTPATPRSAGSLLSASNKLYQAAFGEIPPFSNPCCF